MAGVGPVGRDCARLIALAEAVAELAQARDDPQLARCAGEAAGAAHRFEAEMLPIDRPTVGLYRRRFVELLGNL